jgi:hypothetical protein
MLNATTDSVAAQINNLNAGWRNEVASKLGMDPKTFQLAQGNLGLQTADSSALFLMADAVPPLSTTAFYDPSGKNKHSSAYNELMHAMLPTSSTGLRTALGDQYANWVIYQNADTSNLSPEDRFKKWANRRLDPGQLNAALTSFIQTLSDPINVALTNYVNPAYSMTFVNRAGQSFVLPSYSCTIDVANMAINKGGSASINYNSSTADTSSSGTSVSGSDSGFYGIFSGAAGSSFAQLNQTSASSAFTIQGTINKYATISVDAMAWCDNSQISRAYNAKNDFTIWDPNSNMGNWDSFFGAENGSLARRVSELLLVSDYSLTVTSAASYSESDVEQIKSSATFGIWPFFSTQEDMTTTKSFTHNSDGALSVTYSLAKGLIQIWGATIQTTPN